LVPPGSVRSTVCIPRRRKSEHLRRVVAGAALIAYSWWASGARPFTWVAYVAVGIPIVIVAVLAMRGTAFAGPRRHGASQFADQAVTLRSTWPWILLVVVMIGIEAAGLALGGKSAQVPTISTVVDHAIAWHFVRFILFAGWLAVCVAPLARKMPLRRTADS